MTTTPMTIDSFFGKHRFLSNHWPCKVVLDQVEYPSIEHAYVAAKTTDPNERQLFLEMNLTAGQAKRYGRILPLRQDWEDVKLSVMSALIEQKFAKGSELGQKLIDTYPHKLIEGNTWGDRYWGVCNGVSQNWLGILLMSRRFDLMFS